MDWDSEQALKQNLLNGASVAELAWSTDGGASSARGLITQGSKSVGTSLSFEASIGAEIGPPGEQVKVNVGLTANAGCKLQPWATSTGDQIQTVSSLGALSDPPPPGAFGELHLRRVDPRTQPAVLADLIALLQSYTTDYNTQLLAMIAPNSSPWQILNPHRRAYEYAGSGVSAKARVAAGKG